jgi:hypothetical protein
MGNPFPYKEGEKGTLPLIPNQKLIDEMGALTARVVQIVEQNKQKVCLPPPRLSC